MTSQDIPAPNRPAMSVLYTAGLAVTIIAAILIARIARDTLVRATEKDSPRAKIACEPR